jgi:hypothetical protein
LYKRLYIRSDEPNSKGEKTMKTAIFAVLAISAPFHSFAIEKVSVPVTQVFAPLGFDTNDSSEVVIAGYLPNLCYKAASAETQISGKTARIQLKAFRTESHLCAQMAVPFLEVAALGVLDKGTYGIVVNQGLPSERNSQLKVEESASPAVDDHIYANVSSIERITETRRVLLKGENPSPCYSLDEIKLVSNGTDTYSVLPILRQTSETCPRVMTPFEYEFTIPNELAAKKLLLHVRVMNGKSVNSLFTND